MSVEPPVCRIGGDEGPRLGSTALVVAFHVIEEPLEQDVIRFERQNLLPKYLHLVHGLGPRVAEIEDLETVGAPLIQ